MLRHSDITLSLIIGFAFGLFLIPILVSVGAGLGAFNFLLPAAFAVFAALAIFAAWFLAKWFRPLFQFAKFSAVGALNFSIDFGILNILILLTGIAAGAYFLVFKSLSVVAAIVNSYLWNKFWVFEKRQGGALGVEFTAFAAVSLIGIGINVGAAHLVVNVIGPLGGIGLNLWANIGAFASITLTMFWNFFGYKYFVFKNRAEPVLADEIMEA